MSVEIECNDYETKRLVRDYYRCTNKDCDCDTILSKYQFCPMCGESINWVCTEIRTAFKGEIID